MKSTILTPIFVIAAIVILVIFAGTISIEIDSIRKGYVIGLDGKPLSAVAPRYAWELQLALCLSLFAAFLLALRIATEKRRLVAISASIFLIALWVYCGYFDIQNANILYPLPVQGFFIGGESIYATVFLSFALAIAFSPSLVDHSDKDDLIESLERKE